MGYSVEVRSYGCAEGNLNRKIMMNPHNLAMEDIFNVFFDTILCVTNMRHFNAQNIAHEHRHETKTLFICITMFCETDNILPNISSFIMNVRNVL